MSEGGARVHPDPEVPLKSEETKVPTDLPSSVDMPSVRQNTVSLPLSSPRSIISKSDEYIERLAKLLRTTAGLGSFLSTLSYSLYIVAYLDANSPTRARVIEYISRLIGRTPSRVAPGALKPAAPVSRFAPYIGLINDTRFAIRLTGLLPMYMMLKGLMKNPPKDQYLRLFARVQVASYITFQLFENLWFLSTKGLLSPTLLNRLGGPQKLMLNSCRPWLLAIVCDFLRLGREAQLAKEKRGQAGEKQLSAQAQEEADRKWYSDLFVASSWLPMAVHYSVENGIGMNLGLVGLSGALAGSGNLGKLWAATKA